MSDIFDENWDLEYCEKVCRAAQNKDVPEWVRHAAQRILEISERKNIPIDNVRFKDVGLGLHDNIVESAIIDIFLVSGFYRIRIFLYILLCFFLSFTPIVTWYWIISNR